MNPLLTKGKTIGGLIMEELKVIHEQTVLENEFKVYGTKEQPLFLAKDIASWIGHSNVSKMVASVDEEEKRLHQLSTLTNGYSATFLTEDGLYEVLMQSRKPIAKQFKKQVKEILKQIRLTGGAVNNEEEFIKNYFPSFSEDVKKVMILDLRSQNEKLKTRLKQAKPAMQFVETISQSKDSMLIRDYCHLISSPTCKFGEKAMFKWLRESKYLQSNNQPYQRYVELGVLEVIERPIYLRNSVQISFTPRITAKGQIYFYKKLLEQGLISVKEAN